MAWEKMGSAITGNERTVTGMDEYIERESLYRDSETRNRAIPKWSPGRVKTLIARQKAANVEPVRHAMWEEADWVEPDCNGFGIVRTPKAALRCSNCKNCFKKELLWKENYCPNCGAKMDLEK